METKKILTIDGGTGDGKITEGVHRLNHVYLLTEEVYIELLKCKEELETVKGMIDNV